MSTVAQQPAQNETTIHAPEGLPWLEIVREFEATREQVFAAHVNADLVARWVGPRDLEFRLEHWDARTGGSWAYSSSRGEDVFSFYGSFHEIRTNERIVQTFTFAGVPDAVALEVARFEELPDGRSRLVIRSIGSSVEERDAMIASGMEQGIRDGYERLDELLRG